MMDEIRVIHRFVDEDGHEAYIGSTRLGNQHEVVKTTVCEEFDGTVVFTHTVARPKFEEPDHASVLEP